MAVSDRASNAVAFAQRQVDRVISPETRQTAYDRTKAFAAARPLLFAFLVAQLLLSLLPLVLFASFAASVVSFVLVAGLLFALFWLGVALAALAPTLAVCFGLACLLWAWAVAAFLVARWLYALVPVGVRGGFELERRNAQQQQNGAGAGAGTKLVVRKDEDGVRAEKVDAGGGGEVVY